MRVLVCLAVLAVVVTGHWTHDDALAREIGAPAGEADLDVSMLADEVVSTGRKLLQSTVMGSDNTIKQKMDSDPNFRNQPIFSAKDGAYATIGTEEHYAKGLADGHTANKQYRITIGTKFDAPGGSCAASEFPGPTNCQVQFVLEGEYTTAVGIGSNFDNTGFKALRSYVGPTAMGYSDAKTLSAPLHPGMQAMIIDAGDYSTLSPGAALMCADRLGGAKLAGYNSDAGNSEWETDSCTPCEPNTKECKQAVGAMGAPVGSGGQMSDWSKDGGGGGIAYRPIPLKTLAEVEETVGNAVVTKPIMTGTQREWDGQSLPVPPSPDVHPAFTDKPTIIIQRGQIEHPDVGVIRKVQARLAPDDASITKCGKWKAEFIKIDTNDIFSGVGNGIYYIPGTDTGDATVNQGGVWDSSGTALGGQPGPTTTWAVEDAEITRCMADTCEEEMDSKFGMA